MENTRLEKLKEKIRNYINECEENAFYSGSDSVDDYDNEWFGNGKEHDEFIQSIIVEAYKMGQQSGVKEQ